MSRIFLSYARADITFALRLAADLKKNGAVVWLDQYILPGMHWDRAVEEALRLAGSVLVVLSPDSVASNNVLDEIGLALQEKKTVIPLLHRPCAIPLRLDRIERIDFTTTYAQGLQRLLDYLNPQPPRRPSRSPRGRDAHPPIRKISQRPAKKSRDGDWSGQQTSRPGPPKAEFGRDPSAMELFQGNWHLSLNAFDLGTATYDLELRANGQLTGAGKI